MSFVSSLKSPQYQPGSSRALQLTGFSTGRKPARGISAETERVGRTRKQKRKVGSLSVGYGPEEGSWEASSTGHPRLQPDGRPLMPPRA